jgi:Sulfotransferase family
MTHQRPRCVVILSARSSGSSALQNLLVQSPGVRHIDRTPHFENETLFWVKAASVLGRPQVKIADSRLPLPVAESRAGLRALLQDNIGAAYVPPVEDMALIFDGWRDLCQHYAPVFVEKSPHHLHEWAALELLLESLNRVPEVDIMFVGLVRNPIDTLYSIWQRWRGLPHHNQRDWCTAYTNLLRLRGMVGERLLILRYEDMVRDPMHLAPIYRFMGLRDAPPGYLHDKALGKWRGDPCFRFRLNPASVTLAEQFGYTRSDLENQGSALWWLYAVASRWYVRHVKRLTQSPRAD